MGSPPKISVVIPVYNGAHFVAKAIDSVLAQQHPAHEIIVVNDGSKDDTQQVLDRYRGRIIAHTIPNGGVSNARNEGIRLATGEYIALLDADDIWFRNRLSVNAEAIRRHPEAGFFACNFITRYSNYQNRLVRHFSTLSTRKKLNFGSPLRRNVYGLLLEENFAGGCSGLLFKKSVNGKTLLFDPSRKLVEDMEFLHRAAMETPFLLIDEPLYYKKKHDKSMSTDMLKLYEAHLSVLKECREKHRDYAREHRLEGAYRKAFAWIHFMIGNLQFESGDVRSAFSSYRQAWDSDRSIPNTGRYLWRCLKKQARLAGLGGPRV